MRDKKKSDERTKIRERKRVEGKEQGNNRDTRKSERGRSGKDRGN